MSIRRKGLSELMKSQYLDFVKAPVCNVVDSATKLFQGHASKLVYGQSLNVNDYSTYLFYQFVDSEWTTVEILRHKKFLISNNMKDLISSIDTQAVSFYINSTSDIIGYKWLDSEETLSDFFYQNNAYDSGEMANRNYKFVDDFLISKNIYVFYASWSRRPLRYRESNEVLIADPSLTDSDFDALYCVEFN